MGLTGTYQTFSPFPSVTVESKLSGAWGTCDDTVSGRSKRIPHALLIVRKESFLPTFSGRFPVTGAILKQLTNCPANYNPAPPSPTSVFGELTTLQQSALAWESLAATNPNVPHVSLPSYWAELKDLPSLWRDWGDKFLKRGESTWKHIQSLKISHAAKAHLWYRWGIAPMVNDIRAMFSFQKAVNQRLTWLSRMQTGDRILKRRKTLYQNSSTSSPTTVQLKSVGANIQGLRTIRYHEKVWCTVQWKLASGVKMIPGVGLEMDPLWVRAHQLTFGLSYHEALSALWQIMPWSWFADWFLHVSTVLDATNNTIPLVWSDICLMRQTEAHAQVEPKNSSPDLAWCHPSGQHRQSEVRKRRLLVAPILPFAPSFLPVFTTGQWSILGSLAILRGRYARKAG